MKFASALALAAATALAGISGTAHAATAVTGDTIACTGTPFNCYAPVNTVGAGVEFTYGIQGAVDFLSFDFSNNLLKVFVPPSTYNVSFGGPQFISFRDMTNSFTSATLLSSPSAPGFTQSAIALNDGLLTLNFSGLSVYGSTPIQIALDGGTPASAVPEAATWAMMLVGVGAVGFAMRRRRATTMRVAHVA